ncbi:uncharacterized protein LOC124257385 [Haliotis rubra]|uniref:uncharacterized protein LOC124257385 n=1 Tax=Haliotis rubra TaxID=36100 RepID=UPI001EE4F098|nr:uncharacterized protein LOC124257385 [Haliotis rubra]
MSDGSNHNDDEAGLGEDSLHFPTQESGDTRPTDDHFRSLVDQETYFNLTGETQPHNSPPGLFYSIRLPPSQTANSGYHSIRAPNNAIHFRNYRPHHYSDDPNAGGGAAAAADDDDFGHSDLSESQLGSYDVGMLNLGEVSLGHGNLLDIPVESSLHENVLHSGVNDELYAIGPASLPLGDDSGERDQTCRKSICSVVSEGQEVVDEECHIEQMSLVSVNPPAVESTVSQRGGEQNVTVTHKMQAKSTNVLSPPKTMKQENPSLINPLIVEI